MTTNNNLTPREQEVYDLIKQGVSTSKIAKNLKLSTRTVEVHRKNIRIKLGLYQPRNTINDYIRQNAQQVQA